MIEEIRKSKKHYMLLKMFYATLILGVLSLIASSCVYTEKYNIVKTISITFFVAAFQLIAMNVLSLMIKLKNIFSKEWILKVSYLSLLFTLILEMTTSLVSKNGFGLIGALSSITGYVLGTIVSSFIIYNAEKKVM